MRVLLLRRYRLNSVMKQFNEKFNDNTQDYYIIPPDFFDVPKPSTLAEIPYCPRNETLSNRFIKKFHEFTNNSCEIRIKILPLISLKFCCKSSFFSRFYIISRNFFAISWTTICKARRDLLVIFSLPSVFIHSESISSSKGSLWNLLT